MKCALSVTVHKTVHSLVGTSKLIAGYLILIEAEGYQDLPEKLTSVPMIWVSLDTVKTLGSRTNMIQRSQERRDLACSNTTLAPYKLLDGEGCFILLIC